MTLRCEDVPRDSYLDGELAAAEVEAVEAHLAACEPCRREVEETRALIGAARAHFHAQRPSGDLWPVIATEIERPANDVRGFSAPLRWALVAAAALLVAVPATRWLRSDAALVEPAAVVASADVADWEREMLAASADLEAAIAARDDLSPEARAVIRDNLAVIDRSILEIKEALAREAASPALDAALVATYQHRLRLLRTVANLSTTQAG